MRTDDDFSEPASDGGDWRTAAERAADIAQAEGLKEQARVGGLRFEAYLPPDLAAWVLDLVTRGVFADPAEAVFAMLSEFRALARHTDLRNEATRRSIQAALDDDRPGVSGDAVFDRLERALEESPPEPAVWRDAREG